jgi:hypothetical protein
VLTLPDETDINAEVGGRRLQRVATSHHIAIEITGGGVTMDRIPWRHPNGITMDSTPMDSTTWAQHLLEGGALPSGDEGPSDIITLDCRTAQTCPPTLQALVPGPGAAEPSGGRLQSGPSHRCGSQ